MYRLITLRPSIPPGVRREGGEKIGQEQQTRPSTIDGAGYGSKRIPSKAKAILRRSLWQAIVQRVSFFGILLLRAKRLHGRTSLRLNRAFFLKTQYKRAWPIRAFHPVAFVAAILEGTGRVYKTFLAVLWNFIYVMKIGIYFVPPTFESAKFFPSFALIQCDNPVSVCIEQVQVALIETIIQKIETKVKIFGVNILWTWLARRIDSFRAQRVERRWAHARRKSNGLRCAHCGRMCARRPYNRRGVADSAASSIFGKWLRRKNQ